MTRPHTSTRGLREISTEIPGEWVVKQYLYDSIHTSIKEGIFNEKSLWSVVCLICRGQCKCHYSDHLADQNSKEWVLSKLGLFVYGILYIHPIHFSAFFIINTHSGEWVGASLRNSRHTCERILWRDWSLIGLTARQDPWGLWMWLLRQRCLVRVSMAEAIVVTRALAMMTSTGILQMFVCISNSQTSHMRKNASAISALVVVIIYIR